MCCFIKAIHQRASRHCVTPIAAATLQGRGVVVLCLEWMIVPRGQNETYND